VPRHDLAWIRVASLLLVQSRMRALLLVSLLASGCSDSALEEDRVYRRLFDRFETYDQCIGDKTVQSCYQTFVLCLNRRVMVDLDNRPLDGTYDLDGDIAVAMVAGDMIEFDLVKRSSPQMPGRQWELATPSFTGCDVE
jgi:hypothetical protein